MFTYKLKIEYEGTRYGGWQIQKNTKTIQGVLIEKIKAVIGDEFIDLQGAGRTDRGVHALEQTASLKIKKFHNSIELKNKINNLLPKDINILTIEKVDNDFHARKNVEERSYLYQIALRRSAFVKDFVWWVKEDLDYDKMALASREFQGMKDYKSFCDTDPDEKSTKVYVKSVNLFKDSNLITIRIIASHFLWKMARRMVGCMVEVGKGNLSLDELNSFFTIESDKPAKFTAPPSGLFLEKILYKGEKFNYPEGAFLRLL